MSDEQKNELQRQIEAWNDAHPIGTAVTTRELDGTKTTRTEAIVLFGRKAVIYLERHNGYFDLDDIAPVEDAASDPASAVTAVAESDAKKTGTCCMFPGQGSQQKGMGEALFEEFPDETAAADTILGYSIKELCLNDPDGVLDQTQYTQPALYVVNALTYLHHRAQGDPEPDFVLGHSLGEYSALYASGVFDFETGLRLVQKRGGLMAEAEGGGMAAVIGLSADDVVCVLTDENLGTLDVANFNAPSQTVISGPKQDILDARSAFDAAGATLYVPLKVSAAFHSRYMADSRDRFLTFADEFDFQSPGIPVISNVEAKPYEFARAKFLLGEQLTAPVKWTSSIRYLLEQGITTFHEYGPGNVQAGLVRKIRRDFDPAVP